jgi:hypothetical protein
VQEGTISLKVSRRGRLTGSVGESQISYSTRLSGAGKYLDPNVLVLHDFFPSGSASCLKISERRNSHISPEPSSPMMARRFHTIRCRSGDKLFGSTDTLSAIKLQRHQHAVPFLTFCTNVFPRSTIRINGDFQGLHFTTSSSSRDNLPVVHFLLKDSCRNSTLAAELIHRTEDTESASL